MNALHQRFDVFDDLGRFERLNKVRQRLGLSAIDAQSAPSDLPSIGIEIEMTWDQAIPDLREAWYKNPVRPTSLDKRSPEYKTFSRLYRLGDRAVQSKLRQVRGIIPQVSPDSYQEFSFYPTRNAHVLAAEAQTLYDIDILSDTIEYPLHLTISDVPSHHDAMALLCQLELSGGTTPDRITAPLHKRSGSWAQKGTGGVLKRTNHELIGNSQNAYELRTLAATSPDQIHSILDTAQATVVMQNHDTLSWHSVRQMIRRRFEAQDLPWTPWEDAREHPEVWDAYRQRLIEQS